MPPFRLSLVQPRQDKTATPYGTTPNHDDGSGSRPWVIPVIVAGIIILSIAVVWGIVFFNRRREFGKARQRDPYLSRPEFDKRRKMSAAEKVEEEEKQRIILLRKSLASRESQNWDSGDSTNSHSRRVSQISQTSQTNRPAGPIPEEAEEEDDEPKQLKEDWKAFEARMQRTTTLERHPAAESEFDAAGDIQVALPRPTRAQSPSRSPLLREPLTPPPRNPRRQSTS